MSLVKIKYKRRLPTREVIVANDDIWSGEYKQIMEPVYRSNKETYKVREYREGLVITLPAGIVDDLPLVEWEYESKGKIKISEVFRRWQRELSTLKASS